MAEDTTLATARAADTAGDDDGLTKEELQRRMEQARETITQTVTEIKDTVANQYQSVKETISETLDWREQFRKRPVAWSVGALSVGFVVGYGLAGTLKGDGSERGDYASYEESDVWNVGAPLPAARSGGRGASAQSSPNRSYASQAITGGAHGSSEYDEEEQSGVSGEMTTTGEDQATAADNQPSKLAVAYERFKETKAFDRLQDEVSKLGDRFMDQLSTVGQDVVLPALFGKIKELFGVDLSSHKQGHEGGGRTQAAAAGASSSSSSAASSLASASRGSQAQSVSDMGGLSYGTSENRGYSSGSGGSDATRDDYGRSSSGGGSTPGSDINRGPQ